MSSAVPSGGAAAGHQGLVLLFTNQSQTACILSGYPGAAGLNASGAQLAQAARTPAGMIGGCSCTTPPALTVAPGTTVSAVVEATDVGPNACTPFAALLVTPPNTTASTRLAASLPSCGFEVHPVVTGKTGGGPS
ncbi:MAG: DUF4232 domain-containing protein [Actinobacteria bacterium]|nr:DUF4232 domain-containing protein [Actinomycetota bacterium]